jgi:Flp pilus assembly protein TadG
MAFAAFRRLAPAQDGAVTIETAIVAPLLVLLALGGFDASEVVARQTELDSAAAEGAAIVRAKAPATAADRDAIRNVIKTSIDPNNTDPHETVTVSEIYRCGTAASYVTSQSCGSGVKVSTYIKLEISDTYSPAWTNFGVGDDVHYTVNRIVQVS